MKTARRLWMRRREVTVLNAGARPTRAPAATVEVAPSTERALMILAVEQGLPQKGRLNARLQLSKVPAESDCIDFPLSVHERRIGNSEATRKYPA